MNFVVKNFLQFTLFLVLAILVSEIGISNYEYCSNHPEYQSWESLAGHITASAKALLFCFQTAKDGNWLEFILIKKFIFLFYNKVYWLILGLLILICYYELKSRIMDKKEVPIPHRSYLSQEQFEEHKKKVTEEQLSKLKVKMETSDPRVQGEVKKDDEDFLQDWQENEEKIFSD